MTHDAVPRKSGDSRVRDAMLARFWQLITGPLTQLLLVWHLTAAGQDYFQAFSRMLGLQIFVELGLSVVLISLASHEWAELHVEAGAVHGSARARSRLGSLTRQSCRWYLRAAVVFLTVITLAGWGFFADTERLWSTAGGRELVSWRSPWLALALLTSLQLVCLPLTSILEGCNQLQVLNRVRLVQAVCGTAAVWLLLVTGTGLWSLVGSAAVRLSFDVWLIAVRYRPFFTSLHAHSGDDEPQTLNWRQEVRPLQWRIAVQGMLLWAASQMPLLVIFRFHGEGEAGRLGMTWTVLTALQSASMAWLETHRPQMGMSIAKRRWAELDRLFFRNAFRAVAGLAMGLLLFCGTVFWLGTRTDWLSVRLSERLLPMYPTLLFSLALLSLQPAMCANLYVRAHKQDPFLTAAVVSSSLIAVLQLVFGRSLGTHGVALGYLLGTAFVQTPLWLAIWAQTRREWHQDSQTHAGDPAAAE
jgi:O-antigen/teichoic acid export membrane protein